MTAFIDYDYVNRFNQPDRKVADIYNELPVIKTFGVNCAAKDVESLLSPEAETMVNIHYAKYTNNFSLRLDGC